ncbi:MAG: DUF1573 domain-containing protein [Planctomycetota bacterium]|jgi:hypothetical protein
MTMRHLLSTSTLSLIAALLLTGCGGGTGGGNGGGNAKDAGTSRDTGPATPRAMPASFAPQVGSIPVEFAPDYMDMGILAPGVHGHGTTKLWNRGTIPLTIARSITSCGCTKTADLRNKTIQPGEYLEFSASMEPKGGLGEKMEKVTIIFKEFPNAAAVQFFRVTVSYDVTIDPPYLDAQSGTSGTVRVSARDGKPFSIISAHGLPPRFVGFDPSIDAPRGEYEIGWTLEEITRNGSVDWFWALETDRADCPIVDARVRHNTTAPPRVKQSWMSKDQRILLGKVAIGAPVEFTARMEYGRGYTPAPDSVVFSGGGSGFRVEVVDVEVDGQVMRVRARATPVAASQGRLVYDQFQMSATGGTAIMRLLGVVD